MSMFDAPVNMKVLFLYVTILLTLTSHVLEAISTDTNPVSRQLSYEFNPGCDIPECGNSSAHQINLIHVTADGPHDSIHYLWSTWKLPSVIVARTANNASLIVNWTELYNFQPEAIKFSEPPMYSVGFVIKEIWEFIDEDDKVDMSISASSLKPLNISFMQWTNANESLHLSDNLITTFPQAYNNESVFAEGGKFGVKFSVSGEEIPSDDSPHLVYSANSTQITVVLTNLAPESKMSRFAMKFLAFAPVICDNEDWENQVESSINDEYSPGVFSIIKVSPPCSEISDNSSGIYSWKPVAYTSETPTVGNSSEASMSNLDYHDEPLVTDSIIVSYFEVVPKIVISQVSFNMTFGTSGDGFYSKTGYNSWTTMVGLGKSVSEKMSKVAIIVIAVGLGAPIAVMFVGIIYLGITRCRRKDDDLLLSQDSMN